MPGIRVVSAAPGRVRLRATELRGREQLWSLAEEVAQWPEVAAADVRAGSSSIVVRFDPAEAETVADGLLALGVDLRAGATSDRPAGAAAIVNSTATIANRAVARRLEGTDLRLLVPLGLGMLAARNASRGRDRLAEAPWYVLAWYASETFWKFNAGARAAPSGSADSEEE